MKDRTAARRYARALEGVLAPDELLRSADELHAMALAMESDPRIAEALRSPGIDSAIKTKILEAVLRTGGFSAKTIAFLKLLAARGGLGLVPEVAELIGRARDRKLGIVQAEITTAAPLAPELAARARQALEKSTGRQVRLALRTDSALIGGMVAKVGSLVYDGSVRTRLVALRSHLVRG